MLVQLPNPDILSTPYHYSARWHAPSKSRRIAEFTAGRFCALQALNALRPGESHDIAAFPDGSPRWPAGIVGSITHTESFVSAAIAESSRFAAIGIDSEKLPSPDTLDTVEDLVILDEEQRLLAELPLSPIQGRILVFSAKESVYKCLQPLIQRPFDFSAVCLDAIHVSIGAFTFHLTEFLHPKFPAAFRAQGRFAFSHDCVHTGVELEKKALFRSGEKPKESKSL